MNAPAPHVHTKEHVCWGGGCAHGPHHRLEVIDLSVQYQEVRALEKIRFATECGRSMALIGPNGAGKSTLLKSLAGIIPGDRGKILWRGKPLTRSSHEIAYLPQRGDIDWNFPITVRGLVEMGRYPNLGWWRQYSKHDSEIVERAQRAAEEHRIHPTRRNVIDIDGVDGMLVKVSQCCHPVPGDAIIGFITTGSGISIHKAECPNLLATDPTRWLDVSWAGSPQNTHRASLRIRAENRKNLLADISSTISADDADIVELNARITVENIAELEVLLEVVNLKHLQLLQQHLLQMPEVIEVRRR